MARRQSQLNLGQQGLRPQAQPVDTYYQGKVPVPEGAVDNAWMQAAKIFSTLSPSIGKYFEAIEKTRRQEAPAEAEAVARSFKGDLGLLKDIPSMSNDEVAEWLKQNQGAFGDMPLNEFSRPDQILYFKGISGRMWARGAKVATDRDGNPATYRDALYSRMDEFADPSTDIEAKLREIRESVFDGVDMSQGQQWHIGALDGLTPVEKEFRQIVAHAQQKARGEQMSQAVVSEAADAFEAGFDALMMPTGAAAAPPGETPLQASIRAVKEASQVQQRQKKQDEAQETLKNLLGGYKTVGGRDSNKLVTEAITRVAEQVQDESGQEGVDNFLEFVGGMDLGNGKRMDADGFWRDALREIEDDLYLRGRQKGQNQGQLTESQVQRVVEAEFLGILRGSEAGTTEEALRLLQDNGATGRINELLQRNGLDPVLGKAVLEGVASKFSANIGQRDQPLSSEGKGIRNELFRMIAQEGASPSVEALLLDDETMRLLGGAGSEAYQQVFGAFETAKARGDRQEEYRDARQRLMDAVISEDELRQFPDAAQVGLRTMQRQALENFKQELESLPQDQRDAFLLTGPARYAAEMRSSAEFTDLLNQSYTRQPGLLVESDKLLTGQLDDQLRALMPESERVTDELGATTLVPIPENIGLRQAATIEIRAALERDAAQLLRVIDEPDFRMRNVQIRKALIAGDETLGIPPLYKRVQNYMRVAESPAEALAEAAPGAGDPNLVARENVKKRVGRMKASTQTVDSGRIQELGGSISVADQESEVIEAFAGGQNALKFLGTPSNPAFAEGLKSVHGTRQVAVLDSLGTGPDNRSDLADRYPSNNRIVRMYASALLADPEGHRQPRGFFDNGDYVSDIGVDMEVMTQNPAALRNALKFAVVQDGLSFREIEKGRIREGQTLGEIFGSLDDIPVELMHIGPTDPTKFQAAFDEWANPSTREGSQYQKAMERLGLMPDEESETPGRTNGEMFMGLIEKTYGARREALGDDKLLRNIRAPYSSFDRMIAGENIYRDSKRSYRDYPAFKKASEGDFDDRIHSPAIQYILEQERQHLSDD